MQLDAGPHGYIEDPDIRLVWQEMGSRTSVKARVLLDAINTHFRREYLRHQIETGTPHPDAWTLYFLSKIIFYPSIAEGIDQDSSGFVSVHEVNEFIKSRPSKLNCSVAAWFALYSWAAGPYKTDIEHQGKIDKMLSTLEDTPTRVQPANVKRVRYFTAIHRQPGLVEVYSDVLGYFGEAESGNAAYGALERLRVVWRNLELQRVHKNLEKTQYRLKGIESVAVVTDGRRRLEHSVMALIYLLLRHHLKIVKLAETQAVAVAEFGDMRESWEYLFDALDRRLDNLLEIWKQHWLDIEIQVK
ncbi:hypothetical protein BDW22DRAFT_677359 [Trametopsis cervina]|nr:hypothetical protein BDW22DRAFT_677359 [Trametopsis cervina]